MARRDVSSSSSLPSRETLLLLIDRFILKLPSSSPSSSPRSKRKGLTEGGKEKGPAIFKLANTSVCSLDVFEELELLDSLRTQLEERQSRGMQHALFDAMFGVVGEEVS